MAKKVTKRTKLTTKTVADPTFISEEECKILKDRAEALVKPDTTLPPLECELLPTKKWMNLLPTHIQSEETRFGRYISTEYNGVPDRFYPVGCFLFCNWEKELEDYSEDEILQRCLNYLNVPPPRQKFSRGEPKPKYGKFCNKVLWAKFLPNNSVHAIFAVDTPASKYFWESALDYREVLKTTGLARGYINSVEEVEEENNSSVEEEIVVAPPKPTKVIPVTEEVPEVKYNKDGSVQKKRGRPKGSTNKFKKA